MTIIYKVVKKKSKTYWSSYSNKFIHDYKLPYDNPNIGLFCFKHIKDAVLYYENLTIVNKAIIKGETSSFFDIENALDGDFTVTEHRKFWKLFTEKREPPSPVEIMVEGIFPRQVPYGSIVVFDWKFLSEVVNSDAEILDFERRAKCR